MKIAISLPWTHVSDSGESKNQSNVSKTKWKCQLSLLALY